jgi:hypothetical protein
MRMQIKKILGVLLAVCFLMSVTAAAVSAAGSDVPNVARTHTQGTTTIPNNGQSGNKNNVGKPDNNVVKPGIKNNGGRPDNNVGQPGNKGNYGKGNYAYHKKGHWMYKKTRHNKDRHRKSDWYTNDKYWQWY